MTSSLSVTSLSASKSAVVNVMKLSNMKDKLWVYFQFLIIPKQRLGSHQVWMKENNSSIKVNFNNPRCKSYLHIIISSFFYSWLSAGCWTSALFVKCLARRYFGDSCRFQFLEVPTVLSKLPQASRTKNDLHICASGVTVASLFHGRKTKCSEEC